MSDPNTLHQHSVYRPEIDGMRAIAVLTVIFFHAKSSWVPSGYLGVDMFFVLSGYLITQIIYREMMEGKFSFLEFYKRRAKRILPAFLTVIVFTTLLANVLLAPMDLPNYNRSVLAALFFGANFNFGRSEYFDMATQEKPLLHIWSLSIEEQFYFVFPLILLLTVKILKQRAVLMVVLLIILSLLAQLLPTAGFDPYYLPHLRFYELLIGSLFALLPRRTLNDLMLLLMIAALIVLFLLPNFEVRTMEIMKTFLLCLLTGLMLMHQHDGDRPLRDKEIPFNFPKLLSNRPMVFIGLISYSLYLWHWPLLAFARYLTMEVVLSNGVIALCLTLTFIFAYLAYRFIENPIRRLKHIASPVFLKNMAIYFSLAVVFGGYYFTSSKKVVEKSKTEEVNLIWEGDRLLPLRIEKRGDSSKESRILILGDSHIAQNGRFFDAVGKNEHWAADVVSSSICTFINGERGWDMQNFQGGVSLTNCRALHEWVEPRITDDKYKIIVLGGFWTDFLNNHLNRIALPGKSKEEVRQIMLDKFANSVRWLASMGKTVYLLEDNPILAKNYQRANTKLRAVFGHELARPKIEFRDPTDFNRANEQIKALTKMAPNIHWIDNLNPVILDSGFFINGYHIYRDEDHLNPYGSEEIAKRYIAAGLKYLRPEDVAKAYAE